MKTTQIFLFFFTIFSLSINVLTLDIYFERNIEQYSYGYNIHSEDYESLFVQNNIFSHYRVNNCRYNPGDKAVYCEIPDEKMRIAVPLEPVNRGSCNQNSLRKNGNRLYFDRVDYSAKFLVVAFGRLLGRHKISDRSIFEFVYPNNCRIKMKQKDYVNIYRV